jgi:predicted DNA-binding antitoxin AbrB/MazE fold protein
MTIMVRAVYERGVLRLAQPLGLDEGETVDVTIARTKLDAQTLNEDEIGRRLKAANSIAEWVEATKLLPADDGGYDVLRALNENRMWSGERPLIPGGVKPS